MKKIIDNNIHIEILFKRFLFLLDPNKLQIHYIIRLSYSKLYALNLIIILDLN